MEHDKVDAWVHKHGLMTEDMAIPIPQPRRYVSPDKRLTEIERRLDDISSVLWPLVPTKQRGKADE